MKILVPILTVVTLLALWAATLFVGLRFFEDWQERGQFGDLFGSVNSLFSGLAFAGLIYAIFLQKKELSLQRTELELQRKEMAASRKELAAQVAAQESLFRATVGQIYVACIPKWMAAGRNQASNGRNRLPALQNAAMCVFTAGN